MNTKHRQPLPGTALDFFDARAAVDALQAGAWDGLPYVSRVLAENLVRRCDPAALDASLRQLIERRRDLDFPWFPARVVCHDILGQTALVDLAGLRDAIADQGGDPAQVNPVVPVQLIVDHSLAVECGGFDPQAFTKNRAIEDRRNEDRFHFIDWTKLAFKNVDVIPPGNGIMHQINLERMSPVIGVLDGVAYPETAIDVLARVISMGNCHRAFALTAAMCLAVASRIDGTVVHEAAREPRTGDLRLGHPSGVLPIAAAVSVRDGRPHAEHVTVYRSARRLMEGFVRVP